MECVRLGEEKATVKRKILAKNQNYLTITEDAVGRLVNQELLLVPVSKQH